jgi:hypothetical protein
MGGSNQIGDPEWIGALVQRGAYASCHRWVPRHHLGDADLPVHDLSFVRPDEGLSVPQWSIHPENRDSENSILEKSKNTQDPSSVRFLQIVLRQARNLHNPSKPIFS